MRKIVRAGMVCLASAAVLGVGNGQVPAPPAAPPGPNAPAARANPAADPAVAAAVNGEVIRLDQVDAFIKASRISPGSLEHLYPESKRDASETEASET